MNLAKSYSNLALFYRQGDDLDRASAANRKALKIHEELRQRDPKWPDFAVNCAGTYDNQANYLHDQKKYTEAVEWYGKTIDILARFPGIEQHDVSARAVLYDAHLARAATYLRLKRPDDATKDYRRSLELSEGEKHFNYVHTRPRALAYLGEHERAAKEIEALLASGPAHSSVYVEMAKDYGLCCKAIDRDLVMPAAAREKFTEQYASRSVALLTQAGVMGYFETPAQVADLRADAKLQPLQDREDFRKLVAELEERVKSAPRK